MIKRNPLPLLLCLAAMGLNGCGPSASAPTTPQEVAIAVVRHLGANPPAKEASPYVSEKAATIPTGLPPARTEDLAGMGLEQVVFFTRGDIARLRIDHPGTGWDAVERGMPEGLGCLWVRRDRQHRHRDVLVVGSVDGQPRVVARADLGWGPLVTPPPEPVTITPPQALAAAKKLLQGQLASKLGDKRLTVSVAKAGGAKRDLTESQRSQLQKLLGDGIAGGVYTFGAFNSGGGLGSPTLPAPWGTIDLKAPAKPGQPEAVAQVMIFADPNFNTVVVPSAERDLEGYSTFPPAPVQQWVEERLKGATTPPTKPEGSQLTKPPQPTTPKKGVPAKKTTTSSKRRH
ncbi:MAG: hypothetical protein NTW19_21755 [Planctomycetota bacterium]|nr:hypothetical protein [Planctomycetota bacterium]